MRLFRAARPASAAWNLFKTAVQSSLFWAAFLFLLPAGIVRLEAARGLAPFSFPGQAALALGLFIAFGLLNVYSGIVMARRGQGTPLPLDMANRLVRAGPYRWVRNPMAVGGIGAGVAVGLWLGSPFTIGYALAGALLWHVAVRPVEERDLLARFGDDYAAYRAQVRCWWPRLRRPTPLRNSNNL